MVMPVVDMRQFQKTQSRKSRTPKSLVIILALAAILGFFYYRFGHTRIRTPNPVQLTAQSTVSNTGSAKNQGEISLRRFSGKEFNDLAKSVKYPNTKLFPEPPNITGNKIADGRIRELAESRGYVLTSIPEASIEKINEPRLNGDDLLQPLAAAAWQSLKLSAKKAGVPLSITSAYRSPEYQRKLFMERLTAYGATVAQVAANKADAAVISVLSRAAIPGYSRHHTGYTVDLWCEDGSSAFLASTCFRWISTDNYKIAKQNGWIPSYPEGVDQQGPEPEPWEYIWVGKDLLTN